MEATEAGGTTELGPGLRETRVPKSPRQAEQEGMPERRCGLAAGRRHRSGPSLAGKHGLHRARAESLLGRRHHHASPSLHGRGSARVRRRGDVVAGRAQRRARPQAPPDRAAHALPPGLLEAVEQLEGRAWHAADFITACTQADLDRLQQLNGSSDALQTVLPNGYSRRAGHPISRAQRNNNKRQLGREGVFTALFIGSWHPPNIEAVQSIVTMASALPDLEFWIVGSVCGAFAAEDIPTNLRMLGVVEDDELVALLSAADLALNPMQTGSGSNLKILDYIEHRIPLVSTAFGARGFGLDPGQDYQLAEPDQFVDAIQPDAVHDRGRGFSTTEPSGSRARRRRSPGMLRWRRPARCSPSCPVARGVGGLMVIRVGIDGRSLRFPLTGVGRYTWELTRRLAAMDGLEVEVFAPVCPAIRARSGCRAVSRRAATITAGPDRLARRIPRGDTGTQGAGRVLGAKP